MIRFYPALSLSVLCFAVSACSPAQESQETQTIEVTQDTQELTLESLADNYAETRGFSDTVLVARGGEILLE